MKKKILSALFEIIIGLVGWVGLFGLDWKVGIFLLLILWSNNIMIRKQINNY